MNILKLTMVLYIISVLLLVSGSLVMGGAQNKDQLIAGIPVRVRSERHSASNWFVQLTLPKQYYSKDNLERIWAFYCEKYADHKETLDIRIYVERENGESSHSFDAIFSRQGEGAIARGGDNEFYTYRPDPDKPDERRNVQLKGRYPFLRNAYTGEPVFDLVLAAGKADTAKLEGLLKEGVDVNSRDDKGRTALMTASRSGQIRIVTILLEKGADVNARDKEGGTALREAVMALVKDPGEKDGWRSGHPGIVKILLEKGAAVNSQTEGWTPLLCAASDGSDDIVRLLLARGADANARTETGMTVLARAIYDGKVQLETLKLLLEAGADVNAKDSEGYTPLMRAIGDPKMVRLLIENGADLNASNIHGDTALEIAKNAVARDQRRVQILGWQSPAGEDYRNNRGTLEVLMRAGARK